MAEFVLGFRLVWAAVNVFLILFAFGHWWNMDEKWIKVDIAQIIMQTGIITGVTTEGAKLREIFGYKAEGKDFCTWMDAKDTTNWVPPYNDFSCETTKLSLHSFAKTNITGPSSLDGRNIWQMYSEEELFAAGEKMKTPVAKILKEQLKSYVIYSGPKECVPELDDLRSLQIGFGLTALALLFAHVIFAIFYHQTQHKMAMSVLIIMLSSIVYIIGFVVYVRHSNSKLYTECGWMSQWFKNNFQLYETRIAYLALGILGSFCVVCFFILELLAANNMISESKDIEGGLTRYVPVPAVGNMGKP